MVRATRSYVKPAKKITSTKKAKTSKTIRHAANKSTLLKILPESVEHIEVVQQVAGVLEELQKRVLDVKEEASKELKKLMKRYETNYKGLEKKVHNATSEAKKQAQTSMIQLLQKWHEHKDKLPKPLAKEIEKIIAQIGAKMVSSKKPSKKTNLTPKKTSVKTVKMKSPSVKKARPSKMTPGKDEILHPNVEAKL